MPLLLDPTGMDIERPSLHVVFAAAAVILGILLAAGGELLGAGAVLVGGLLGWYRGEETTATRPSHASPVPDGGEADIELVMAIIRPGKLNDVKRALADAGAPSLTVTNVSGRGTQPTETGQWRGSEYIVDLHQKVKVECVVTDDQTGAVVDAIQEAAHTGEPGDGKIFVLPVYDACRVSTDERGIAAM